VADQDADHEDDDRAKSLQNAPSAQVGVILRRSRPTTINAAIAVIAENKRLFGPYRHSGA
jgi:hypothetical protein